MGEHASRQVSWRLPGYTVESLLGRGADGEVWRARVKASGDRVALKRLALRGQEQLRAARSEAAVLTALDHPHLVRIHQFVTTGQAAVLVLDLAEGGSLARLLVARGRLTPAETIAAIAPIGAALAYAHGNGVIHGDVTPANVLFSRDGLPLLADLGVARLAGSQAPVRSTPAYVDPAVAAGCAPGPSTDVFMLAATAVHALTGAPLWQADSGVEALALAAAADTGGVASRLVAARVPEAMIGVLTRALSAEPRLRGTAADLALDLRHSGEPVAVELGAGHEPAPGHDERELAAQSGPRHAAPGGRGAGRRTALRSNDDVGARPPFPRSSTAPNVGNSPALTHGAQLRAPVLPHRRGGTDRRLKLLMAAGALALLIAGGAVLWWSTAGGRSPGPTRAARAPRSTHSPHTGTTVTQQPSRPAAANGTLDASGAPPPATIGRSAVAAVLSRLDALRARAFATRDPHLLARVYVAGPLLTRDTARLKAIVPAGCGLHGAHTSYRDVAVTARSNARVAVLARARLAASSLRCAGAHSRPAPGAGPVMLRITLVRRADGYRILEQTRATGPAGSAQTQRALEGPGLQALFHRGEEPRGVRAVDDAVVVGQ